MFLSGWCLSILLVAAVSSNANAQLAVGPNGVSTPPINLLSVFKFLRDIFLAYMYPKEPSKQQPKPGIARKPSTENTGVTKQEDEVEGIDTNGNIVERFDFGCDNETEECATPVPEEYLHDAMIRTDHGGVVEEKTGSTQLVLGKWPILYIVFIITLFWLLIVIASPYVIAGESIGRREDDLFENSLVDQQDVFLLLAFLLGEVSENNACLERVVCMTPSKSSNYITISSMIFKSAKYLQSWGAPYSKRYVDLLERLNDVAHDGYSQHCESYFCPTVPNI
ncbi:hypothetical protein SK128_003164 [Halocaridina rubra]|uniref:Uncharacterized protein n=1 Tax=Halocaridina rubra TaxID=373956 RepID=A0AAN8WJG5_HALRR